MTLTIEQEAQAGVDQLVADLHAAREIMAQGGLCKEAFRLNDTHCLVGALLEATDTDVWRFVDRIGDLRRVDRAIFALAATLGEATAESSAYPLYRYNDSAVTSKDDVIGLIDTTISRLIG